MRYTNVHYINVIKTYIFHIDDNVHKYIRYLINTSRKRRYGTGYARFVPYRRTYTGKTTASGGAVDYA